MRFGELSGQQIEYRPHQPTGPVVEYLISTRDNVASVRHLAEHFINDEDAIRAALKRLSRVGRVACIHEAAELWHLE
jgi:hypothetical protein